MAPYTAVEIYFEFKKEELKPETSVSKAKTANNGEILYCEGCDYKTNRAFTLKAHKNAVHEGVKIPCDQCEAKFAFQHSLKKHKVNKYS